MKSFTDVFTYTNLLKAVDAASCGVGWKTSVINFKSKKVSNVSILLDDLKNNTYKMYPKRSFTIAERGKTRHIQSIHFRDRVVQRCLCDNYLVPLLRTKLIYDSGATLKGKGLSFSLNRMRVHLTKFGLNRKGYILLLDFSKYFQSINIGILLDKLRRDVNDRMIYQLIEMMLWDYGEGLSLGNQISQILALYYVAGLDKYIKEKLKVKYYGRYMDDCYLISESKEQLQKWLKRILEEVDKLKLKINMKKTRIYSIHRPFKYLNRVWILKEDKVYTKPPKKVLYKIKRKYRNIPTGEGKQIYKTAMKGYLNQFSIKCYSKIFKGEL